MAIHLHSALQPSTKQGTLEPKALLNRRPCRATHVHRKNLGTDQTYNPAPPNYPQLPPIKKGTSLLSLGTSLCMPIFRVATLVESKRRTFKPKKWARVRIHQTSPSFFTAPNSSFLAPTKTTSTTSLSTNSSLLTAQTQASEMFLGTKTNGLNICLHWHYLATHQNG